MRRLTCLLALLAGCGGTMTQTTRTEPTPPAGPPAAAERPLWTGADRFAGWCDSELARADALVGRLRALPAGPRTVSNTLAPYHEVLKILDEAGGWASLLFNVHPDAKVREAAQGCQQKLEKFDTRVKLDRAVYDALSSVDTAALDAQGKRFVEHLLRDFRRAGVDRDEPTRAELQKLNEEIVKLSQDYRKNVREDVRRIELPGPEALRGLPEDYVKAHPPGKDGKIVIDTDYPDFYPFETYAEDTGLRAELYKAFMARGYPANKELLAKVVELRHRVASLLGYPSWAAYMAEDKMVKTAETIDGFIADVAKVARPRMQKDLATLLERKRQDDPKAAAIEVWDRFYYVSKVREAKHGFDARAVRPYFSYPRVKEGILQLYSELFGVRLVRLPEEPVWDPKVEAWALEAKDGRTLGVFYLDMHPREGKYKHAAMFGIRTGLGADRVPRAALVCNFPDPADGDGKALMEHSEVLTFFHEFGHLIHHLLAQKSPWVTLAGINVEWDFVEAPSQLLEEWGWDPGVLQRFAKHVDTGEPIPADLVKRMRAAEEFGKGVDVMRQIFYAAYSFYLHGPEERWTDLDAFDAEIFKRYSPFPSVDGGFTYPSFEHLIGYSSMYYTYQWSLSLAKDIFTRFKGKGLLDPEVARAYREEILEPGGSRDAADLVERFLGRKPNLDAYRSWLEGE